MVYKWDYEKCSVYIKVRMSFSWVSKSLTLHKNNILKGFTEPESCEIYKVPHMTFTSQKSVKESRLSYLVASPKFRNISAGLTVLSS